MGVCPNSQHESLDLERAFDCAAGCHAGHVGSAHEYRYIWSVVKELAGSESNLFLVGV